MTDKPEAYIVCGNVDMIGNSIPVFCCECSTPLVRSRGSMIDQPHAVPICYKCTLIEAKERAAKGDSIELLPTGPAQAAEIAKARGEPSLN